MVVMSQNGTLFLAASCWSGNNPGIVSARESGASSTAQIHRGPGCWQEMWLAM